MCRNVPKRCVVSGVLVSSVLVLYIGFGQKRLRCWPRISTCPRPPGAAIWVIFYYQCLSYRAQHRSAIACVHSVPRRTWMGWYATTQREARLAPDFLGMRVCLVASSLPKVSSSPSAPMDRHQELSNRVRSVPGYLYLTTENERSLPFPASSHSCLLYTSDAAATPYV